MLSTLKKNSIIKFSYSLKLTVVCLLLLVVLTAFGTIYQADNGLHAAKLKFFTSWFFLVAGIVPIPGAALVLLVLFINLLSSMIFRIGLHLRNIGNILTHLGILILLVGSFFTFLFSQESVLKLKEGEKSSWSNSYRTWELSVWKESNGFRYFAVIGLNDINIGKSLDFPEFPINIRTEKKFDNASAFSRKNGIKGGSSEVINSSGIVAIEEIQNNSEPEANVPAVMLYSEDVGKDIILYGGDNNPTSIRVGGELYNFYLRRQRRQLPLEVGLIDFRIKKYPDSEIVKSYESTVEINHDGLKREVIISMNRPLRFKNFTFFQSSYQITPSGEEYSIFAVVKNSGRLIPYISSIIIFIGLLIHFVLMLFKRKKETR